MGLFDKFRKSRDNKENTTPATSATPDDFRLKERLLEMIPGGTIEGDAVRMDIPLSAAAPCVSGCGSPEKRSSVTIRAEVNEVRDNGMAILYFYINSPDWDREIFEVQVGVGETPEQAIAEALFLFRLTMLDSGLHCLGCAKLPELPIRERTEFAGRHHDWNAWLGNIVSRGAPSAAKTDTRHYWNLLREELLKRLGDQKFVYVKVFAARQGKDITLEVRLNNRIIPALSECLRPCVETWEVEKFCSHKQFFFLVQDAATHTPWPHDAAAMRAHLAAAARLFHEDMQKEGTIFPVDAYVNALAREITPLDDRLACEIFSYLPELLAEHAFPEAPIDENITVSAGETEIACYRSQLGALEQIEAALDAGFIQSLPKESLQEYVGFSSIGNVVNQVVQKHGSLEKIEELTITLHVNFPADYALR